MHGFKKVGIIFNYSVKKQWYKNELLGETLWRSEDCKCISVSWTSSDSPNLIGYEEHIYDGQLLRLFHIGKLHFTHGVFWNAYQWLED